MIRKAKISDIEAVSGIYDRIHTQEEAGRMHIGWVRDVYPVRETALKALKRGELFVEEEEGCVVASAIINQKQLPEYQKCHWKYEAEDRDVCVLHTLVVDPKEAGRGYGKKFIAFYESHARSLGCHSLRIDTQEKNLAARGMYNRLGFTEAGVVSCVFNGISDVKLVCLEKKV